MSEFRFKHFSISQKNAALKVGTDAMILGSLCQWNQLNHALDIGSGTGVLSLMIAQRFNPRTISAVELDENACIDATYNFKNNPFNSSIQLYRSAIQDFESAHTYDGIISNPPFFVNSLVNQNTSKATARHTQSLSYIELIDAIQKWLSPNGQAWIILPAEQEELVLKILEAYSDLFPSSIIHIEGKPTNKVRFVLSIARNEAPISYSTFTIRDENGNYTEQYKRATIDFHDRVL